MFFDLFHSRFGNGMASEYTSYLLSLCTFFGGCTWCCDMPARKLWKFGIMQLSQLLVVWVLGYIYFNLCLSLFPSSCIFLCFRSAKFFHRISIASLWYLVRWRSMMNVFWSWKIVKGLVKTLSKARHSQWPYPSPLACAKMMNMYTC